MTHIQVQKWRKCVMSLKYTPVTQSILCLMFLMYLATVHCFNQGGQGSKKKNAVYDSYIPVTFKYVQGHQTWYELLDPKQD